VAFGLWQHDYIANGNAGNAVGHVRVRYGVTQVGRRYEFITKNSEISSDVACTLPIGSSRRLTTEVDAKLLAPNLFSLSSLQDVTATPHLFDSPHNRLAD
jgi:hypothetical protein